MSGACQVSPPGCHPAVCKKKEALVSAIASMKAETCDSDDGKEAAKPVTISAGSQHTVRIVTYKTHHSPPSVFVLCDKFESARVRIPCKFPKKS